MTDRSPAAASRRLERAIILQLLSSEEEQRCSSEQLASALDAEAHAVEAALSRLADAGVVCLDGTEVWASAAARRMDELGFIGI
jgi:Mn-dependent DtxR family transcriptional regulator